jgi:hypothetical protein
MIVHDGWVTTSASDPATLDYQTWTHENRSWFQHEFPWLARWEQTFKSQNIPADYLTLLMVSGDIWQFHYTGPNSQKTIPVFDVHSVNRLADYYQLDRSILLADQPGRTQQTSDRIPSDDLARWQADLSAHLQTHSTPSLEKLLFTLQAADYLAKTSTAAYLWIKTHPEQARTLFATFSTFTTLTPSSNRVDGKTGRIDPNHLSRLFPGPTESLLEQLKTRIHTAHRCLSTARTLVTQSSPSSTCSPQRDTLKTLDELLRSMIKGG